MFGVRSPLVLALTVAFGCSDDCHDVPCGSSLIVELAPEQGFADGAYEVTLDSPQGSTTCSFVISGERASELDCGPYDAGLDSAELPAFMLVRYFQEQPETVHVTVTRDGDELAASDLTPEYEQVLPNAKACGGPCTSAQVSVAF